jgi:hypothetical protein
LTFPRGKGSFRDLREQRLIWLILNYPLWRDLPLPPTKEGDSWHRWRKMYQRELVEQMRADGVVARSTYWLDVNVPSLIRDAMDRL